MPKSKNPAVTPEMAREAVLEAARMGLRGRAARPGRNPRRLAGAYRRRSDRESSAPDSVHRGRHSAVKE